jgi:predicted GNAT superfamily acetyltransferase
VGEQGFSIRRLQTAEEFLTAERLQQVVWQYGPADIPKATATMLAAAERYGGLVLGAFDESGRMIGLLFGFPGRVPTDNPAAAGPEWQHCSRLMGILPEWRGRGVGYRLKLAQREWALSQGYGLVSWTYDPLEAANGVLNLGKLGAVCRCYLRDFYGAMPGELNVGLPSDRFEVAWWVGSERVHERVARAWHPPQLQSLLDQGAVILNAGRARADGWLEPGPPQPPEGERVLVEIPHRIQAVKAQDLELALAWRLNVREVCEAAFDTGYTACDVIRAEEGAPRVYLLLEHGP